MSEPKTPEVPEEIASKMWMLRLASFNYGHGVGTEQEVDGAFASLRSAISKEIRGEEAPRVLTATDCPIHGVFKGNVIGNCTCPAAPLSYKKRSQHSVQDRLNHLSSRRRAQP